MTGTSMRTSAIFTLRLGRLMDGRIAALKIPRRTNSCTAKSKRLIAVKVCALAFAQITDKVEWKPVERI